MVNVQVQTRHTRYNANNAAPAAIKVEEMFRPFFRTERHPLRHHWGRMSPERWHETHTIQRERQRYNGTT